MDTKHEKLTREELFKKVLTVPDNERLTYGRKLLKEYTGEDKDLIGPWLEEFIIASSKIN